MTETYEEALKHALDRIMLDSKLRDNEAQIIRERFGLDTGQPLLLEDVGKLHGMTRERIRQIEATGLRKMRQHMEPEDLGRYAWLVELLPFLHLIKALWGGPKP